MQVEPYWACARVHPQREAFAAEHLEARGFETFVPKIAPRAQPLFRGYAFVLIVDRWRAIETTFGVLALVRFGDAPARCPDREIDAIRAMVDEHGFVRLPDKPTMPRRVFRRGAKVKIIGGAFQGVSALHSGLSAAGREILLLSLLGATRQIKVPSHQVALAG
jgi:transcriptional antiterminator RfaH